MTAKHIHKSESYSGWIHSSRLHVIMYSMLLVATPFLILQNFLQDAIGRFSVSTFELGELQIPIVPILFLALLILLIIAFRSYLTRMRMLAGVIALLMIALAQQVTDYYFDHRFYELQQNWHYIAYSIFAFIMYRDLAPRGIPLARIILITFIAATLFSSFDEVVQKFISSRVFDIGDIAKDIWGTLAGLVIIYFGRENARALPSNWKQIRHKRLHNYLKHPFSLIVLMFILSLMFLVYGSLLTEFIYLKYVILLTICSFVIFFILFHISQYKWGKYSLVVIITAGLLVQTFFFVKHRSDNIIYYKNGLMVYKGIPIFFFDIMIFPDGTFRLVDKKYYFKHRDRVFLMKQKADIVIIGSGAYGEGGLGFSEKTVSQFIFNPHIQRGTQFIIIKSSEACQLFNSLKQEKKNVLFVLHNTY